MHSLTLPSYFSNNSLNQIAQRSWYGIGRTIVDAVKHIIYNLDVVYHTRIPAGARLLCANHPTTIDPVMMTTLVPEQVSILISETLFKVPLLGKCLALGGHIPVLHSNGRQALEVGIRCLQDGRTVGIFPEGAISPEVGGMARVHTGAARLAIATGAPVMPIGIALDKECVTRIKTVVDGKVEVGTWYFHGAYAITVGGPIVFQGDPNNREYVRAVTEEIASRITALSQECAQRLAIRRYKKSAIGDWFRHLILDPKEDIIPPASALF